MDNHISSIPKPFYDYSISLSSFIALDKYPFIKSSITNRLLSDPLCTIGVIGGHHSGKTKLFAQLEKELTMTGQQSIDSKYDYDYDYGSIQTNDSNAIYFKSLCRDHKNASANILFIKSPSLNKPLLNIEGIPYKRLMQDRLAMNKFSIGFISQVSHILIVFNDKYNDMEKRKYYHEIIAMRHPKDLLLVIHNLALCKSTKDKEELIRVLKSRCNEKNFLELDSDYRSSSNKEQGYDYMYCEKNTPQIIHLLYEPLTNEEYKGYVNTSTSTRNSIGVSVNRKKNNGQMIRFIISLIQTSNKTNKNNKENIIEAFEDYLQAFIHQVFNEPIPKLVLSSNKIQLNYDDNKSLSSLALIKSRGIASDIIPINYNSNVFKPCYSYRLKDSSCIISFEKTSLNRLKIKEGKVIGSDNVLTLIANYNKASYNSNGNGNGSPSEAEDKSTGLTQPTVISSLYKGEFEFQIRIPTNTCVINNFKAKISYMQNESLIELSYGILTNKELFGIKDNADSII